MMIRHTILHVSERTEIKMKKVFTLVIDENNEPIIVEGGGLTNLRSLVEREFGKMIITSKPEFELKIEIKGE